MTEGQQVRHLEPVWRDRSDFIITAVIEPASDELTEQLWARRLTDDTFELCCIPFFTYGLSLGDVVRTRTEGPWAYLLWEVVRRSGRGTFRVWFGAVTNPPREKTEHDLRTLGCLVEWSSENLLAVDAADEEQATAVLDHLAARARAGDLEFERG